MTNNPTIDGVSLKRGDRLFHIGNTRACGRGWVEFLCFDGCGKATVRTKNGAVPSVQVDHLQWHAMTYEQQLEEFYSELSGGGKLSKRALCHIRDLQSTIARLEARITQLESEKEFAAATYQAARDRIAELEQDKARLDALDSNCWDVRFESSPNGDSGDSSINIEVVGHWMDQPFERVIGENYSENLRAAIDQAMTAPTYPPERPEYPEIDACLDATAALNGPDK